MRGGYLLIPVVILLASIISGETPGLAGFKAVVSLIVMVDLVRALRWIRSRWATPGVSAAGILILLAFFLAYGPVSAPQAVLEKVDIPLLGPIPWIRLPRWSSCSPASSVVRRPDSQASRPWSPSS